MSPWTALLESLHSSLIDELNEQYPHSKPELGMPIRQSKRAAPAASLSSVLACAMVVGESSGVACLACDEGLNARALWDSVLKRAGAEFSRRNIRPRIGTFFEMKDDHPLSAGMTEPQRMIWIPFKIEQRRCFLGLGV